MNELSIIKEVVNSQEIKPVDNSRDNNQSGDSGLASSNSGNDSSGTNLYKNSRCLIIQFQALNAESNEAPKESTFVMNKQGQNETCNVSRIDGSKNKETINSEDGRILE